MKLLQTVPNLLTGLRLVLAVPLAYLILEERYDSALLLAALAGISDALDGFLARRLNAMTRLGAALDPIADKLLILAVFGSLAAVGILPVWLAAVVIGRDLVIVGGAAAYRLFIGPLMFQPTWLSKINMGLQIVFLVVMLAHALQPWLSALAIESLIILVAIMALASGLQYVLLWSRKAATASAEIRMETRTGTHTGTDTGTHTDTGTTGHP